ncbi:MAG: ACT domain-containing protein [Microcella pacifica]
MTLRVHSSLDAVGLTAAVAAALTENGISCNVMAGAFHDHLFVPAARLEDALVALKQLSARDRA